MEWIKILETLGITTIFSTAATLLIGYFISRKYLAYEKELENSSEQFKNQLYFSLETHKITLEELYYKSSKLHDKRLEIISNLYGVIVDLDMAMTSMTSLLKLVSGDKDKDDDDEKERIKNAGECYSKYQDYFSKNRIYFSLKTCELLDKLRVEYWDSFWDYTYKARFGGGDFKFNYGLAKKASEKVQKDIPLVLEQLENDFRKIIKVEEN